MATLTEQILERARTLPEGAPLRAKELLHLGSRAAIDQSLSRLVRGGQLLRAGRGLYLRPIETRFGARPPAIPRVIAALVEATGETLASNGAAAANALGLTTQVPVLYVYLTSGRSRRLSVGAQSVELRHAPAWQLVLPVGRAGLAIRAIAWFGEERSSEVVQSLRGKLSSAELQELAKVNRPYREADRKSWWVRWSDEHGHRCKRSFDRHADAEHFIAVETARVSCSRTR